MVLQKEYKKNLRRGPVGTFEDTSQNREMYPYANKDPLAKQKDTFVIDSAVDDTDYDVEIEGFGISADSGSGATVDSIASDLTDAINDEPNVTGVVSASVASDTITVESFEGGLEFTATTDDPNITHTAEVQSASEADPVPFGRGLLKNGQGNDIGLAKLPAEADLNKRVLYLEVDTATDNTDYGFLFDHEGTTREVTIDSGNGATLDSVVNDLQAGLDGLALDGITVTANTTDDRVEVESETAGFVDFDINSYDPALLTLVENQAGDALDDEFAGIAIKAAVEGEQYPPRDQMTVATKARVFVPVEQSVSAGDDVYMRLSANGNNDEMGVFTNAYESGVAPLRSASFKEGVNGKMAVVDLKL